MMNKQNISDEFLNSYIDNELESDERNEVFDSINRDEALKARLCELRSLKEMVQLAYPELPAQTNSLVKIKRPWPHYLQTLAACLLLLLFGGASGWVISENWESRSDHKITSLIAAIQSNDIPAEPGKIIIQISNSNPVRLKTALDETESLLENYKQEHRPLKVEVIANGSGVDLLRSDVSPYGARIGLMKAKYPNLDFVVCNQTVSNLQKKGVIVHLLPHIGSATSAIDEINKRLLQGWDFVRV